MKYGLGWVSLVAVLMAFLLVGMRTMPADQTITRQERLPISVVTSVIEHQPGEEKIRFHGITRGADRTKLAFSIRGQLLSRPFEVGDSVDKHQVLATLEAREHRLALTEAKANLAALEANLGQAVRDKARAKVLFAKDATTLEEVEKVGANHENLKARQRAILAAIDNFQRRLKDAQLLAPFSGKITSVLREPGEYLNPGTVVLTMSSEARIEVEIEVPEALMPELDTRVQIEVTFPFLQDRRTHGSWVSIGRSALGRGSLFPIIVELAGFPGLVPGLSVELLIARKRKGAVRLPLSAVINPGGQQAHVFVAREGQAQKVPIDVLSIQGDGALVQGRFETDERVISHGHHRLLQGDHVTSAEEFP